MDAAPFFTNAEWAQQLATERALREQAEAELAQVRARLAVLEQPAAGPFHALHTQIGKLVHHLRLGVVLVDGSGQIQYVSPHFWRMFGLEPVAGPPPFTPGQLAIGEAFADPAAFNKRVWAMHTAGKTALGEAFLLRDGRRLVLDYLVFDEAGAGRIICYRDVTRAHQRITRIRAISHIPEQNPDPVFQLTATGETVYANLSAGTFLQALAAEPAHQQWVLKLVRTALGAPAQPHPAEMTVAGQHYQLVAAAVPGQAYVTLCLTDITARHQAEQQMVQQREFYESVLEQVPIAVVVFDDEHRYLFVNSSAEPDPAIRAWMLGKTSTETFARRPHPAASAPQRAAAFAEVLRTGREVQWEETLPHADGTVRHIMIWYRPVRGLGGTTLVIGLAIDLTERKRAEQLVIQQQEFYESILNLVPFDVAVFDAEHRFLFVNPASVSDAAVRQQIIGLANAEYFALRQPQPPELAEQREQYFALAARTRTDVMWEEMRTDCNQRPQLMLRHLRPVSNPDGTLRLMVGAGIDITPRYLAEKLQQQVQQKLQEQQEFVRQVVDTLPDPLYVTDAAGHVLFSNLAFDKQIASSTHLHAQPENAVIAEEQRQMQVLNEQVLATGQALTREMPYSMSNGQTLYFKVHKRPMLRANEQVDILTFSADITAVKEARQELERREKQYHDLVYYSQALICTHDLQGNLLSVNPAIERLLGVPAAQLVGRNLREVLRPPYAALRAYLKGANLPHDQARMVVLRTGSGELRYLHYYTYQVTDEGRPPYVLASGYDVTSGVLAERALRHAKQQAEENSHAKETFLARMSHEIRTPLNGVLGMAALLKKTPLTAAQQEYLNTMQHAGRHLLALLNDVLDMAKISADHLQLNQAPFDVAVVLHGAGQAVAALAAEKGLTLVVEPLAAALPRVLGDAYRLHQVLLNLLGNALKFTESGSVRLGAAVCPGPGRAHEAVVRFWVEDTGIGMTPAEQSHIFEAFAQANTETSLRFGGTGLGLAISQQLVVQMGGTLRVCSEPGWGTTFSFQLTLPHVLATTPAAHPGLPPAASYEGLRGLRVLLAEDNLVNQQIAMAVLEHWGVQVHAVSNGTDALARLQAERFDVAILDIRMPGLSGVEVTQAIRRHPEAAHANIPIIALTANAFESDLGAYLAAGMTACLTKPYEEADLCGLILRLASQLPRKSA